jgi:hypothetical protein
MAESKEARNKALVLKAFDTLFNKRDYAAAERLWSPNYIQHSAHIEPGREGLINLRDEKGTGYFFMTGGRSMQPAKNRKVACPLFLSRRETKRSVQPFQPESESWSAKRRINESR